MKLIFSIFITILMNLSEQNIIENIEISDEISISGDNTTDENYIGYQNFQQIKEIGDNYFSFIIFNYVFLFF